MATKNEMGDLNIKQIAVGDEHHSATGGGDDDDVENDVW